MESLLSSTAGTLDLSRLDNLAYLFELDAYNSWATMEMEAGRHKYISDKAMQDVEDYLDSILESTVHEFQRSFDEMEKVAEEELSHLLAAESTAKKSSKAVAATSKRCMDRAVAATVRLGKRGARTSGSKIRPC